MGELIHVPIFLDVDETVTIGYQQEPFIRENEEAVKKSLESKGMSYLQPTDYMNKQQEKMTGERCLTYLDLFIWDAQKGGIFEGLTNERLKESGRAIKPAKGLADGLKKLKDDFKDKAELHYFLVSMGIKPLIEGFVEANGLEGIIEGIAASEFTTDKNGVINGIQSAVTSFSKNEWIISFMKGDNKLLNVLLFPGQYKFDYRNMIVVGDGFTDAPMFSYAKKKGGIPVVVYDPGSFEAYQKSLSTIGMWADYVLPRDYSPDSATFGFWKEIIGKKINPDRCSFMPSTLYNYKKGKVIHPEEIDCIKNHLEKCRQCQDYFTKVLVTPEGTVERHKIEVSRY